MLEKRNEENEQEGKLIVLPKDKKSPDRLGRCSNTAKLLYKYVAHPLFMCPSSIKLIKL